MSLEDFNQELRKKNLIGYWMIPNRSDEFREPRPSFAPFLWKWQEVHDSLKKAVGYIRPEEAYRRFIGFQHPDLKLGTSHTLLMGAQMVCPGERAPAHRHMMEAIRFIVNGRGACTIVEGEQFPMEEGDLITTPNWSWHDHVNAAEQPIIWVDGANGPMIHYFQVIFAEPYAQPHQAVVRPVGWSERHYGVVRPSETSASGPSSRPPYRYRWEETEKALETQCEGPGDPFDGALLRFVDPLTGGPTLPSMSCEIQLLRGGEKTRSHRHSTTSIFHAFRGSGVTVVENSRLEWEEGDSFVVPLWSWHHHENISKEPAVLFSINDRPAVAALGFYREEEKKE